MQLIKSSLQINIMETSHHTDTDVYKRINRFTKILNQYQAKESADIPPNVFEAILKELKKSNIDKNDLDLFELSVILRKLNLMKYY